MRRTTASVSAEDSQTEDHQRIHTKLCDWSKAIAQRDRQLYAGCYSRDFLAGDDPMRGEWLGSFSGLDGTDAQIRDARIYLYDRELAKVEFHVRANLEEGATEQLAKEMLFVCEDGDWRIRSETDDQARHPPQLDRAHANRQTAASQATVALRDQPERLALQPETGRPIRRRAAPGGNRPKRDTRIGGASARGPLRVAAFAFNTLVGLALLGWLAAQFSPAAEQYLSRKYRELTNQPLWVLERDQIDNTLNSWVGALAGKDVDRYLAQYSDEFFSDDPEARRRWQAGRGSVVARAGPVQVAIQELDLQPGPTEDSVRVYLKQVYKVTEADYLLDKRLVLKKDAEGWRIVSERTKVAGKTDKSPQPPAVTPATVAATDTVSSAPAAGDTIADRRRPRDTATLDQAIAPPQDNGPGAGNIDSESQSLYAAQAQIATADRRPDPAPAVAQQATSRARRADDPGRTAEQTKQIINTAQAWAAAWSQGNAEDYLSFYGENFEPPSGQSRSRWQRTRRQRLSKPKWIEVELSGFSVRPVDEGRLELTTKQKYTSDTFTDSTTKVLLFERVEDQWKIISEVAAQ